MAAAGFYFFNYVPHLEKLVKVSLEAPNFLANKGDTLHVFDTSSEGAIFDSVFY